MSENTPTPADDVAKVVSDLWFSLGNGFRTADILQGLIANEVESALAAKPDQPAVDNEITRLRAENERYRGALELAANRLKRAALEIPLADGQWRNIVSEWGDDTLQETGDSGEHRESDDARSYCEA